MESLMPTPTPLLPTPYSLSVGPDQSQVVKALTRKATWDLVIAGLIAGEPSTPKSRKPKALSARQTLALVSREMSILQGWFEKYIREDEQGCWIWHGATNRTGYGMAGFRGSTNGAHRAIWQILIADLPRNIDLDHLCRVRLCVNPDHLEPVTRSMNLTRGAHPTQGRLGRAS